MRPILRILIAAAIVIHAAESQATLLDRGPDMVYDNVINITWTRNGHLPGSSGLTWDQATNWAANLEVDGIKGWRLPYASVSGQSNAAYCPIDPEFACRDNEMGYMFYYNLGGFNGNDKTGTQTALSGQQLTGIQSSLWSRNGEEFGSTFAWVFGFNGGGNVVIRKDFQLSAWAVHDGDIAPVPEPSSFLLIGAGMLGLAWMRRSRWLLL